MEIVTKIKRGWSMFKFAVNRHSPEILVVTGIALTGVAVATAIKSTTKANEVLEPHNDIIETIKSDMEDKDAVANGHVDLKLAKKELNKEYLATAWDMTKLYLPTIVTFVVGSGCILAGLHIVNGRLAGTSAALAATENAYRSYRERVAEKIGAEAEQAIYKDIRKEKVVDENGNEVEVEVPHKDDDYARSLLFDESSKKFMKNRADLNFSFLQNIETYANLHLQTAGYMFLYEVYQLLEIDMTTLPDEMVRQAQTVGWVFDPTDRSELGFREISFGLTDEDGVLTDEGKRMMCQGNDRCWLEFNYYGDIINGGPKKKVFSKFRTR